ncbi:hypothetical protein [Nostoc sp.]|uniref:hypothetical protein n=1 Tax=Nostoc sp. TaxID=1180 RepID=UPI002FF67EAA
MNPSPIFADKNVIALNSQVKNKFAEAIKQSIKVGTGGSMLASMRVSTSTTGGILYVLKSPLTIDNTSEKQPIYSIQCILSTIRSSLSLNMKEMAKILKVERPTVYAWIGGNSEPHPSNRNRLNEIFSVAKHWETLSALPVGNFVRQSYRNGKSVVDLLSEDVLDKKEILTYLELLAKAPNQGRNLQKAQSKPSVRELAAKHNLKVRESSDTIDWLTGKRIDAE